MRIYLLFYNIFFYSIYLLKCKIMRIREWLKNNDASQNTICDEMLRRLVTDCF